MFARFMQMNGKCFFVLLSVCTIFIFLPALPNPSGVYVPQDLEVSAFYIWILVLKGSN